MTFVEYALARQFLAEERIGPAVRAAGREEDQAFADLKRAHARLSR